ncbi:hypothetical protein [Nocardioides sp. W7]|uniref:hypothetical protein n=1 Tax=Nocardioides sp. W7 TaxID=2931390 RepID=UPI001FD474EA|nr:hypothetical protein [Nocardioides sp. W7]
MRIRAMGAAASVLAVTVLAMPLHGAVPAQAASAGATVVRGTAFPDPQTAQLSLAGCATMSAVAQQSPQPFVGLGPSTSPSGQRSLGYDLAGGSAVGALFQRASMAATSTADLQVHVERASSAVVYAGYQEPADDGTARVWVGRADVSLPPGTWRQVSAIGLSFTWTKRDLGTGAELLPGGTAPLSTFMTVHGGDGSGFYSIGAGCGGGKVSLDTFRVGTDGAVRSYDLEGLSTTTTISGTPSVEAGEPARLTGAVRDQSGARVARATLVLEQRTGDGPWTTVFRDADRTDPVVVDAAGADPVVEVNPERTTSYRFRFADRPLAEGSTSTPFEVAVTSEAGVRTPPATQAPAKPKKAPAPAPTPEPTTAPTPTPETPAESEAPSEPASDKPAPEQEPEEKPDPKPSPEAPVSTPAVPEPSESTDSPAAAESAAV